MAIVIYCPHPLSPHEAIHACMPEGMSYGEVLDDFDAPLNRDAFTVIFVDGVEILRPVWDERRITAGDAQVVIMQLPGGGGGGAGGGGNKQIYAAVALIAIAVVAPYAAAAVGATGFAATAITAGVTIAGGLMVQAIFKPPMPRTGDTRAGGNSPLIQGQSNQATPFGVIPRLYGRLRMFPRVAAIPFTFNSGGATYLNALYDFGFGPLEISDIKIGSTPIEVYQGVEYVIHQNFVDGDELTLYANDHSVEGVAVQLNFNPDTGTRVTTDNTDRVVIDLVFPQGIYYKNGDGTITGQTAIFIVTIDGVNSEDQFIQPAEFSRPGVTSEFLEADGYWVWYIHADSPTQGTTDGFGASIWLKMPFVGQHTITVARDQPFAENYIGNANWVAIRSIGFGPALRPAVPHTIMELRVRATGQLSGVIDTISAIATSVLFTGNDEFGAPTYGPTSNPAWIFYDVLTGTANNRPRTPERVDLLEMVAWAAEADTEAANDPGSPQYRCDIIFDWKATTREALQTVAGCGRAGLNNRDGRFSVVRDSAAPVPVQLVTKLNSFGLSASMSYPDPPHAMKVQFLDELTWTQQEVVVYADDFDTNNSTVFEELQLVGIIRRSQAWRFGRYYLAQGLLRRERATFSMDVENLVAQRGDIIGLATDVMKVGGFAIRVHAVTDNFGDGIFTRVQFVSPLEDLAINAMKVRYTDERGLSDLIPIIDRDFISVQVSVEDAATMSPGDLAILGTVEILVGDYIVESVHPGPDLTASLTVVEHRPDVLLADSGPIPPRLPKPGLTPDGNLTSPAPLLITVYYNLIDGVDSYDFYLQWSSSMLATGYRLFLKDGEFWTPIDTTTALNYIYTLAAAGQIAHTLTFGVQAYSIYGLSSEIVEASVAIDPANDPWTGPPVAINVVCTPEALDVLITFDDPGVAGNIYEIRVGPSWAAYDYVTFSGTTSLTIPPQTTGVHDVWIKIIDTLGHESQSAAHGSFTILAPLQVLVTAMSSLNIVQLLWGSSGIPGWAAKTTHSIDHYEVAKGFVPIGNFTAEYMFLIEAEEGLLSYEVRAVDVAGNVGPWGTVDVYVTGNSDYALIDHRDILPEGTLVNAAAVGDDELMPFDTAQTWQSHFTAETWTAPQDQVDGGFPLFAQPGAATSSIEWEHDYVTPFLPARLMVLPNFDPLAPTPIVTRRAYAKADPGDAWTDYGTTWPVALPASRLVKVVVTVEPGADREGMLLMHAVDYKLDVHYLTDAGTDVVLAAGTFIPFNISFVSVTTVQLTPASGGVLSATYTLAGDLSGMTLTALDSTGTAVDGTLSWLVRGT